MDIYRTTIRSVGSKALAFLGGDLLITYYPQAPESLRDYYLILSPAVLGSPIRVGDILLLGDRRYPITAVSPDASENLKQWGNVSLRFDSAPVAGWSGSIHLSGGTPLTVTAGETFGIEREGEGGAGQSGTKV
ncbi:hypothetical protein P22_1469 [Propionispora sp. 2/2-37]|uniref:PTS glucitol/sorbitol transporter subunit IIA n=1 Tax=Propionispora sp. 2/2-37 TaxID=1677858 RepID=UPI0006BB8122|nr:PTS glucitol/sorbitol transporter subunit IIA [Propionispora sp. 2/2-37]CUH95399.1 hypothetical protein P22_1469 [Propionispora sp. 2/2-37]